MRLFEEIYREGLFGKKKEQPHPMDSELFYKKAKEADKKLNDLGLKDKAGSGMMSLDKVESFTSSSFFKKGEIGKISGELYNMFDGTIMCYIEGIEVDPALRNKGIAASMVDAFVSSFKDDELIFLLQDFSGGFWEKMKQKYPSVTFRCY
jgi:predicted GNAT family acetyltransferase